MLYTVTVYILLAIIRIFNGKTNIRGKNNLPEDETYILIAPHKSILDPIFIALAAYPRHFTFMAKKELFEKPFIAKILEAYGAFPVNRQKPGPSAIKTPVKKLKETEQSLLIFPTGTRHSQELKGGAVSIGKLSEKKIIPVVYEGPFKIKEIFKLKKAHVSFGEPFRIERKIEGIENINQYYIDKIQEEFNQLESNIS